jgi:hypothetical protein
MTQKEINEWNKLIAEFMGRSITERHGEVLYADWDGLHSVKYNESWGWLMPVVEKIELINPNGFWMQSWFEDVPLVDVNGAKTERITVTYRAVVEFIKWHNTITP